MQTPTQTQAKKDILSKDENKRKVEILFLDSSICNEYSFIPRPAIDAIRPSITADLIGHTEKDILIETDGEQHWVPKAKIRSIYHVEGKQTLFVNEPYYKLYADRLDKVVPQSSAITIGGKEATPEEKKALEVVEPLVEKHCPKWWNEPEALKEAFLGFQITFEKVLTAQEAGKRGEGCYPKMLWLDRSLKEIPEPPKIKEIHRYLQKAEKALNSPPQAEKTEIESGELEAAFLDRRSKTDSGTADGDAENSESREREPEREQADRSRLSDNRSRAVSDLQRIYGVLTELKAEMLYQRGKISSKEYEKILDWLNLPTAEEETALQEHKEQQAEEKDLVPIEVLQKFKRVEREEEKQTQKKWF